MSEKPQYKCQSCPCVFFNVEDLHNHKKAFDGRNGDAVEMARVHSLKWYDEMKRRQWTEKYGEQR